MGKALFKIVVVGGGYAGTKAALELAKDEHFHVTLISDSDHMRVYVSLYHTATGGSKKESTMPLSEIFADPRVKIVIDTATALDRQKRTITTKKGTVIDYNAVILSLGVRTNYFGIKGLDEYSYGIKSLEEAEALKAHLHKQLVQDRKLDLNYVVVGGGPTGVELAGVLPEYLRQITRWHDLPERKPHIDLIEAAPHLLPRMPKDMSRKVERHLRKLGVKLYLKTAVEAETADALMVHGQPIRSHTVIWTAGMSNNKFFADHQFQLVKNGKVRVDQFLQAEPGIYVLGDNADTPYSGMAQTALYDGAYIAKNLSRIARSKAPIPYRAKKPIYVMPAGPEWAAVLWGNVRIYGKLGWALRRAADFIGFRDYLPWKPATKHWMAEQEQEESCLLCMDNLA